MKECKKCLLYESAQKDTLKLVKEHIEKIPAKLRAEESLYNKRLEICKACEHLISGTCMKCGCYVEMRAAFLKQRCPDTRFKKW